MIAFLTLPTFETADSASISARQHALANVRVAARINAAEQLLLNCGSHWQQSTTIWMLLITILIIWEKIVNTTRAA